jgi:hypothetical protein
MSFEGRWICQNGEQYTLHKLDRPGGMHLRDDDIYKSADRADLRWDRAGNGFREEPSIYKYYETQWNRAPEFDLVERISEKDTRR